MTTLQELVEREERKGKPPEWMIPLIEDTNRKIREAFAGVKRPLSHHHSGGVE